MIDDWWPGMTTTHMASVVQVATMIKTCNKAQSQISMGNTQPDIVGEIVWRERWCRVSKIETFGLDSQWNVFGIGFICWALYLVPRHPVPYRAASLPLLGYDLITPTISRQKMHLQSASHPCMTTFIALMHINIMHIRVSTHYWVK